MAASMPVIKYKIGNPHKHTPTHPTRDKKPRRVPDQQEKIMVCIVCAPDLHAVKWDADTHTQLPSVV